MSVAVSWSCHCDDCGERIDNGSNANRSATAARKSGHVERRKMRDGKLYDFCRTCLEDRARHKDDSVPTETRR